MASFRTVVRFPVKPERIYRAWLSSRGHAAMTGAPARMSGRKGGRFSAADGYISGKNLKLRPEWCIVQSWRTTEFPRTAKDSQIELCIHPDGKDGAKLVFTHSKLTPRQVRQYRHGWNTYYWKPMRKYFGAKKRTQR
jgi:uncharacterized protein YndB with AHSA1/START domain